MKLAAIWDRFLVSLAVAFVFAKLVAVVVVIIWCITHISVR